MTCQPQKKEEARWQQESERLGRAILLPREGLLHMWSQDGYGRLYKRFGNEGLDSPAC